MEIKTSEQTDQISGALAKAQGAFETAEMNAQNPHFKNQYANLGSVKKAIKDPLAGNDISYVQVPHFDFEKSMVGVSTRLNHKSGQWMHFPPVWCKPARGLGPQDVGAAMTYLRRYSLSCSLGITQGIEEDDDGNTAEGLVPPQKSEDSKKYKTRQKYPEAQSQDERIGAMLERFKSVGVSAEDLFNYMDLPLDMYEDADFEKARQYYQSIQKQKADEAKAKFGA